MTRVEDLIDRLNDVDDLCGSASIQVINEDRKRPTFATGDQLCEGADILFRRESAPTGYGVPFKWKGGMHQLNWTASKETVAYAKFDWVKGTRFDDRPAGGSTLAEPKETDIVLGVQHLLAPAQKVIAEFRTHKFQDLAGAGQLKDNGVTLRFMLGF